eukprot:m.106075 g.106075  ORF g.106075 m.106075 type:complete len:471 (+) comp37250_c0_seq2:1632-3044(+)
MEGLVAPCKGLEHLMEGNGNKHVGVPLRSSPDLASLHHFPTGGVRRIQPFGLQPPEFRLCELNRKIMRKPDDADTVWWDSFASEFFEDDAQLHLQICFEDGVKAHRLGRVLIPRFFRSLFDGGVTSVQFSAPDSSESFVNNGVRLETDSGVMTTTHTQPYAMKSLSEGRLTLDFVYDEYMRIRQWDFIIRQHQEMIPRPVIVLLHQQNHSPEVSENVTKLGLTEHTLNFLKLCVILQPMQELMSRHKTYNIPPRECLKTTLFNKWQQKTTHPATSAKSVPSDPAPPPPHPLLTPNNSTPAPGKTRRLKRKHSNHQDPSTPASTSSQPSTPSHSEPSSVPLPSQPPELGSASVISKKRSPESLPLQRSNSAGSLSGRASVSSAVPATVATAPAPVLVIPERTFIAHDVMVVGEPSLMGGDYREEDERLIARLENVQFDPSHDESMVARMACSPALSWQQQHQENEEALAMD